MTRLAVGMKATGGRKQFMEQKRLFQKGLFGNSGDNIHIREMCIRDRLYIASYMVLTGIHFLRTAGIAKRPNG